jgi:hypothetical protein
LHHLNKKHWNHIGWQENDFPPTISSICLSYSSFILSIRPCMLIISYALFQQWLQTQKMANSA